ncbi:MAG: M15 family metallopeptidase [Proteobacteria bacterium]|nr:M15 family metallopeptidase [Pseudomonadota bacterium]
MKNTLMCEDVPDHSEFTPLASVDGIRVDLRYATSDNFVGRDLYTPLDCAWLHRHAAQALEKSVAWLAAERPGWSLLVLDAMRPQRVQEQLWAALQGTELLGYLAPPERGSIHSFGMAVDITLIDGLGQELDMGTPFDDLSECSHPALEDTMLARGDLSLLQVVNRKLLRAAMHHGGWIGINSEWWHFDCGDRNRVREHYTRIL